MTFGNALIAQFKRVEVHYEALFEKIPEPPSATPNIVVADENDPAALAGLGAARFQQSRRRNRRHPRLAIGPLCRDAKRTHARAADRVPALFARCLWPLRRTRSCARHVRQGHRRDAGGAYSYSPSLAANPSLLRLIADIMGTAPRLAHILGRRPRLLDAVLDPGFFGAVPTPAKLKELVAAALAEATDYQDALDRARIIGREQAFLIGVRVISGTLSARQAGAAYADLAETLDRDVRRAGRGGVGPRSWAACRAGRRRCSPWGSSAGGR